MSRLASLIDKLYNTNELSGDELLYILENLDEEHARMLFEYARRTRDRHYGNRVYMRGLIEFSNVCRMNCLYCGIRAGNPKVARYRLSEDGIFECCREGYALGYRTFVLQSGEDPWYTADRLVGIIGRIKKSFPDAAITLSIGEREENEYRAFFEAGAQRYLLRHETASRSLYERLHPGANFDNRIRCLWTLKEIGYQVGAGFMVGLPGQTKHDLVEDLLFLKRLNPHMIGIGPFIPHKETPLGEAKAGSVEETLVMLALARLLVPDCLLPATTAMGTLHPRGREQALMAGANVVMPNLSPVWARPKYELYQNKICTGEEAAQCRSCIERRIRSVGMEVDMGRGDHIKFRQDHGKFA